MYLKSALYSLTTMMQILEHLIMLCAVCCKGNVAQSFSIIGVVVKKVTGGPIQLECCIWIG